MTKVGFNILIEKEFIDILDAYAITHTKGNKTAAFRRIMREVKPTIPQSAWLELEHQKKLRSKR